MMTISGTEEGVQWTWTQELDISLIRHQAPINPTAHPAAQATPIAASARAPSPPRAASARAPSPPPIVEAPASASSISLPRTRGLARRAEVATTNNDPSRVHVPKHSLHGRNPAGVGGNLFYGSFTIVKPDHTIYHHPTVFEAHPTSTNHTEPQYFEWLAEQMLDLPLIRRPIYALIMEINQNNTPCSSEHCRGRILSIVKTRTFGGSQYNIVIARMSASKIYESGAPHVMPTSTDITNGRRNTAALSVDGSMCIHRYPSPDMMAHPVRKSKGKSTKDSNQESKEENKEESKEAEM